MCVCVCVCVCVCMCVYIYIQLVLVVKNSPANAGVARDVDLIPGEAHGNPLQYSYLENSMDRRAWWVTVHRVAKNQTQLDSD